MEQCTKLYAPPEAESNQFDQVCERRGGEV